MTTDTFDFGNGPVPAHRHSNGGGWVADTASVAETACVGPNARVYGNAQVSDNAWVHGNARVHDNARVSGAARVYGNACVYDNARVSDNARVRDDAWVSDDACVYGDAQVYDDAWVYGAFVVPVIADIHQRVLSACEVAESFDMRNWHCGTSHCRAGWIVTLAGAEGAVLETQVGTGEAAWMIYQASDPTMTERPEWVDTNENALADMRRLAGQA